MAIRIQKYVIRLHIAVHNVPLVDVYQSASDLRHPEPYSILCKCFAVDMKPQVSTIHEVHHDIAVE